MRNPKLRGFLDSIYRSAKRTSVDNMFNVSVKEYLWRERDKAVSVLLGSALPETHEACFVAKFVKCIFRIDLTEKPHNSEENDSFDEEETPKSRTFVVRYRCEDIDVRRTVIDFGRRFTISSVAGGSLRRISSANAARCLALELYKFSSCKHQNPSIATYVCTPCAKVLMSINCKVDEKLNAAARQCCAISNSEIRLCSFDYRRLAFIVASILTSSMEVRRKYYEQFESNQRDDIRFHNSMHQYGAGLADDSNESWLAEEQRTGEIFPGRPAVRPRLDSGAWSKRENARKCRKNYTKSESH